MESGGAFVYGDVKMRFLCCYQTPDKLRLGNLYIDSTCAELGKWAKTVPSMTAMFSRKYVCSYQSTHYVLIPVVCLEGCISHALMGNAWAVKQRTNVSMKRDFLHLTGFQTNKIHFIEFYFGGGGGGGLSFFVFSLFFWGFWAHF